MIKVIGLLLETKKTLDSKKKTSHIFRGCWQKLFLKVLENSQKNVLSSVPFKQFDLPNPATYNRTEADSTAKIFRECSENF